MTVSDYIDLLLEMNQDLEVYKVVNNNEFQLVEEEDLAEITLGHQCDEEGNEVEAEDGLRGLKMVIINFESADSTNQIENE